MLEIHIVNLFNRFYNVFLRLTSLCIYFVNYSNIILPTVS